MLYEVITFWCQRQVARIGQMKPGIETLFMSGFAAGVIGESGILPDGVNFLQKPFAPDALMAT